LLTDKTGVLILHAFACVSDFFETADLGDRFASPAAVKITIRATESTAARRYSTKFKKGCLVIRNNFISLIKG
jgi:hypothetical protein